MANVSKRPRTDTASRTIAASPQTIYRAFLDPEAWVTWLPPAGMAGEILAFDAREGGTYRMALIYDQPDHAAIGKTSEHADVIEGVFVELAPDRHVIQAVNFVSEDPAFAGEMHMTWSLERVAGGTAVRITCENVPEGIRPEDHDAGLRSTLGKLAAFVE
ncbi:SRPBCC family protein [Nitratireductor soli]|uniref:SRPBCC family protein n=1 Tax=Nitratireductor soli TaxID=1670619 RepID=UPI00065E851E|nr:SRPBCC family protein [Nitratireductor soli]